MNRMSEWQIHSIAISRAELKKELKPWCCPLEIMIALGASLIK
jgi:hypothetical protein